MSSAARSAGSLLALGALLAAASATAAPAPAAAGPRCPPRASCREKYNVTGDYYYEVEGTTLKLTYLGLQAFELICPQNVSLDSANLPRFDEATDFSHVILKRCAPPASGLAGAFARLRVQPRDSLKLLAVPGAGDAALTAAHLDGLRVRALKVEAEGSLAADDDWLARLPQLRDLRLSGVRLAPGALLALPAGLKSLWLTRCGLQALPRAALQRLPALRYLQLREPLLRDVPAAAAPALAELLLAAPLLARLPAGATLENATLINMNLTGVDGYCGALRRLLVVGARELPAGGLAQCAGLQSVSLLRCTPPPPALLLDLPALRELSIINSGLRELPRALQAAARLERLELADNELRAPALAALEPLGALRDLSLSGNPLGDLCHASATYITNDVSPLRGLRALRTLRLQRTGATRVCRDWRDAAALPALRLLDLSNNNITELGAAEAQWPRGTLDVRRNPLRAVVYSRADYESALAAAPPPPAPPGLPPADVLADGALACDCLVYWFARALRERPGHAASGLAALRCSRPPPAAPAAPAAPPTVLAVSLDLLECAVPQAQCAAGCSCAVSGERSVLRCADAALRALPAPPAGLPPPRALLAARNRISDVPHRLPPELAMLDLRDNAVAELPQETWAALLAGGRRVLLAGNPLLCGCAQRAALTLLQAHAAQLDADNATCPDGRSLRAQRPAELCALPLGALLGALAAAALLLAVLALAALVRPASRRRFKRFLVRHNLCLRLLLRPDRVEGPAAGAGGDGEDAELKYDVFVSFSHRDHDFVTQKLLPALEGAARPRRLCLHYRDWTPGEWIPTQIAESVRRSRRTLVVVSEHFLRSHWARAEFRAAHALALRSRRPRLVVLLLAPPATLAPSADPELAAFLASNTYLRHDDPRFWDKLLDALPASAPPAPPPPPPPAAPPAPPPAPATAPCA